MSDNANDLNSLCSRALAVLTEASPETAPDSSATMRERFMEFIVIVLANLYGKTPIAGPLIDRTTLQRVTAGMDDGDAAKLAQRGEDWMRLEGMVKQQEGQKSYYLPRPSLSALSALTTHGTLGEVCDRVMKRYTAGLPSANTRLAARDLGSYILTNLST